MRIEAGGMSEWDFRWRRELFDWELEMLHVLIEELGTVVFRTGNKDRLIWLDDSSKCYSVKSAYKVLTEDNNMGNQTPYKKVWHKLVPLKVAVFGWQVFQDRIPSKVNLCKRGIIDSSAVNCAMHCGRVESSSHILFDCNIAHEVWMNICRWIGVNSVMHNE
jgi:hypothetical protein